MKTIVITGAGSGVGQAVAIRFARMSWNIALIGRRKEKLNETAKLCQNTGTEVLVCPCDIMEPKSVMSMADTVMAKFGTVHALVNSAGVNTPDRSLRNLKWEDYRRIMGTNLDGAYLCIRAFLDQMRRIKEGTIVNINSDAGKFAYTIAGHAYSASKFGLVGLTQAINNEERNNGIRACNIFPGEINTELLDKRPDPPNAEYREQILQPYDLAETVAFVVTMPQRVMIEEMLIRPRPCRLHSDASMGALDEVACPNEDDGKLLG